jgi:hypothetical protein
MGLLSNSMDKTYSDLNNKLGLLKRALIYLDSKKTGKIMPLGGNSDLFLGKNTSKYYNIINAISVNLSCLALEKDAYVKFNEIITENLDISKNALLIYSPVKRKYIYWNGNNINDESIGKLEIELDYEIYKSFAENNHYIIHPDNENFKNFSSFLSNEDLHDSDFLMMIPFVFSKRLIGILLVLKINNIKAPDEELINCLKIIGNLNGALLYNLYQQDYLAGSNGSVSGNNNENDDYKEFFGQELQKLIIFTKKKIETSPDASISVIHFKLQENILNADILNISLQDFTNSIQYAIMNIVGTSGFVEILKDMDIYIILPNTAKEEAEKTALIISEGLKNLIKEKTMKFDEDLKYILVNYPNDVNDHIEMFLKLKF